MNAAVPNLIIAIVGVLFLVVSTVLGLYVYRDAKARGMNAALWTLVTVLVPAFVGLMIYVVVRNGYGGLRCGVCQAPVHQSLVFCPQCGAKLRPACPACDTPVQPDWMVCPKCARPLPPIQTDLSHPVTPKKQPMGRVLLIVILVPLLLLGLLGGIYAWVSANSGSVSYRGFSAKDYAESDAPDAQLVRKWLETLPEGDSDCAYVLRYDHETQTGMEHYYLIYVPGTGGSEQGYGHGASIFGTTLEFSFHHTGSDGWVANLVSSAQLPPKLEFQVDGKKIPCELTVVDFNPTMFYIEP